MKDTLNSMISMGRDWIEDKQRKAEERDKAQRMLFKACQRGDAGAIVSSLARGASVNEKDADKNTPLHLVIRSFNAEALNAILDARPDLEAKDKEGRRPLHIAAMIDNDYAAARFIASGCKLAPYSNEFQTPLMLAAEHGRMDVASMLLTQAIDVNTSSMAGETALHFAARSNHVAMVQMLINHGASTKVTGEVLGTPLEEAKKAGAKDAVACLGGSKPRPARERGQSLSL